MITVRFLGRLKALRAVVTTRFEADRPESFVGEGGGSLGGGGDLVEVEHTREGFTLTQLHLWWSEETCWSKCSRDEGAGVGVARLKLQFTSCCCCWLLLLLLC